MNNVITVIAHAIIVAITCWFPTWLSPWANGPNSPLGEFDFLYTILGILLLLAYVACGFLLMPTASRPELSVVFIAIILLIVAAVLVGLGGDFGLYYLYFNPIAALVYPLNLPAPIHVLVVLLSPVVPSLLLYGGIVLRSAVTAAS